jgi:hypothetical protein
MRLYSICGSSKSVDWDGLMPAGGEGLENPSYNLMVSLWGEGRLNGHRTSLVWLTGAAAPVIIQFRCVPER